MTPTTAPGMLRLPWRGADAPHRQALSSHAQEWAERLGPLTGDGVARQLHAVDPGGLATLTYPGARLVVQRVLVEFFAWIVLQDDVYDYVEGHRRWMKGACDWQRGARRYAVAAPWPNARPMGREAV
jgi:hypothetical protein